MASLRDLPAPAKINVFLHVTGRRADGLHHIQSVMQLLALHDTLHIDTHADPTVRRIDSGDTPADLPADDLCVRAARLLQAAAHVQQGCTIDLHKRIPSGAGLGGGSSDAATVLMALNRLWACSLTQAQLMALGAQLGADVPFFIFGRTAWVEGVGDQLSPFDLPPQPLLLVKPPQGLATAGVYRHVLLRRDSPPMDRRQTERGATMPALMAATRNDLQPVAELIEPAVALAQEIAASRTGATAGSAAPARMSGSGSCVFALSPLPAPRLAPGWFGVTTQGLPAHPITELLA